MFSDLPNSEIDAEFEQGTKLFEKFASAVATLVHSNLLVLEQQPSWGLLHSMYKRAAEHVDACLLLISHGRFASAEALCRTAVESSINLGFCSAANTESIVSSYFNSYIEEERRQNAKWLTSVNSSEHSEADKQIHRDRISAKNRAMDNYEAFVVRMCGESGNDLSTLPNWPNVFERFRALGKEITYRTVYASLCSQAHNDAEDLINKFMAQVSEDEALWHRQMRENSDFAKFMVIVTLAEFIHATLIFLAKYPINSSDNIIPFLDEAWALANELMGRSSMSPRAQQIVAADI